ncbi:alcohol dehydrogenase catalytic domain-containing protein [Leucobacter weissii]|uniref:Alcohol dehydrogenase catalytic domain-containing protein n=1 Tax=Leucobacter weissii TaxID=1983706 RepID=A0A939ML16_9MICO|nr:zinc-binding dehydrogenase [Leucobacter weissii]MBO1900381.1 alcohol dehydrogenase catalytic domain-containing protein [Leucobacter weissii]
MNISATAILFSGGESEPQLTEVSVRAPRAGEVLVRMTAAGVCHSDLHVLNGDWPFDHRVALGHEGAGIVEAVGEGVDLVPGDQVVLSWYAPCGRCDACVDGKSWLCAESGAITNGLPDGSTPLSVADGEEARPYLGVAAFSEYTLVPRSAVVKIPSEVPSAVAALIGCSIATGIGAVLNTADVRAGQTAVVVGAGGVGQAIVLGLKLAGASRIIAVDLSDDRLEIARQLGATDTVRGDDPEAVARVRALAGGAGVDFAFDAIGVPKVTEGMPAYVKSGGAIVLVGMPARDAEAVIKPWQLIVTGQRILGCNYGSSRPQVDFVKIARLYLAGQLPLDQMVGETIPQSRAVEAVRALVQPVGKRRVVDFAL